MNKRKLAHFLVCVGIVGLVGCANTEPETVKRNSEEYLINGASYASSGENEENVFGSESKGLKDNPKTKPSSEMLGPSEQYEDLKMTLEPDEETAYINEIVKYTLSIKAKPKPGTKPQFVIVLEKAGNANGSLIVDKDYLFNSSQFPPSNNTVVVKPNAAGKIEFRVQTGTSYNNKNVPMYYVNVWHVDFDSNPLSSKLYVKRPAQIDVDDLDEGTKDVDNDLSMIGKFTSDSSLKSAQIVNLDPLDQQLFALDSKKLHIQIEGECASESTSETTSCDIKNEPICWSFVENSAKNHGSVSVDSAGELDDDNYEDNGERVIAHACRETDDQGKFWVQVDTGNTYNSRYYLNFFHPKAAPLTYKIDTFALPPNLGDLGSDATIEEEGLAFDSSKSETNKQTGETEIVGCNAADIIDKYIKDESVRKDIEDQCGEGSISSCDGKGSCSKDSFKCKLVQNSSAGWTLKTCSGEGVLSDVDGDGDKDDLISLVVVTSDTGEEYFNGLDTDGDGTVDVAPDICIYTACDPEYKYHFLCSKEDSEKFVPCSKFSFLMNSQNVIKVKLDGASSDQSIDASIIRGSLPSNNAMFDSSTGSDSKTIKTDNKGVGKIIFWSGTAYDALYYIKVENKDAKTVLIPISVTGSVSMPTAQGDAPDASAIEEGGSAYIPPAGMDPYDINLEDVEIVIPEGMSKEFSAPVIKTLNLKVQVRKKNASKTLVSDTKTWWKVTRGESLNNNGTLVSTTATTDLYGIATNQFYTGTGYDSVYYVSVFHPNAIDSKKNLKPFIFTIKTVNDTGSVIGPDESSKPSLPSGGSTTSSGETCTGSDCKGDLSTVNGQPTNDKLPQKSCDDIKTCTSEEDLKKCSSDSDVIPECCSGEAKDGEKVGCLELILDNNSDAIAYTGSIYKATVRLVWRNGSEKTPVRDNIIWTLDKGDGADGELMSEKTMTNKDGYASVLLKTGSKETKYRINAMYPNIHKDGNMVPKSIFVSVKSQLSASSASDSKNTITLTSDTSGIKDGVSTVHYFVMSSYNYSCDDNSFLFGSHSKAKEECGKRKSYLDNAPICEISSSEANTFKKTVGGEDEIPNGNDRIVVYATAYKDDKMVGYGCSDMNVFGAPHTTSCDKTDKSECPIARDLMVNVRLDEVPMVIKDKYETKTVVNLGPLLKTNSQTSLYKSIDDIFAYIRQYSNIGDMLYEKIESIVFIGEKDTGEQCFQAIRTVFPDSCEGTLTKCCANHPNSDQCSKSDYTGCGCICGDFYYYLNTKIGKLVAPALKSGLKSLLKKYLNAETLQNTVCDAIDDLQFITLEGELQLKPEDNKYVGQSSYRKLQIPYLKESIDLEGDAVTGKWREATLSDDQFTFKDYSLKLTYGTYIYQVLGKIVGVLDEKTGEIKFDLNCEKIFANGIMGIGAKGLQALCKVALARVNTEVKKFAVSQYVDLNLTLQGSATLSRGDSCASDSGSVGCVAQFLEKGIWAGSGSLGEDRVDGKTKDTTINGVWVARVSGAKGDGEDGYPELTFGGQSLDEFKAANSICREKMKESVTSGKTLNSNKDCLLGSYNNAGHRASTNACEQNGCKDGGAIVVCENGKFADKYNNSSAADIIRAANKVCKDTPSSNGCSNNDEIVNGGKGITNAECKSSNCAEDACKNNTSIFVCKEDGSAYTSTELDTICADIISNGTYGDECVKMKVSSLCNGREDDPGCVMNSENTWVYNSESGASKPDDPVATEEKLANIVFNNVNVTDDGEVGKHNGFVVTYKCLPAKDNDQLKAKSVAGPDGTLNAVGSRAIYGPPADSSVSSDQCYFMITSPDGLDKTISKVEFKINPAGRTMKYDYKKTSSEPSSGGTPIYGDDWKTLSIDLASGVKSKYLQLRIWPNEDKSADYNKYKMYRLADIVVYGY